jgi:hypothetical protein
LALPLVAAQAGPTARLRPPAGMLDPPRDRVTFHRMVLGLTAAEFGTLTTALVGAAGITASALTRRGDRTHERRLRLDDRQEEYRRQRESAYVDALAFAERLLQHLRAELDPHEKQKPTPLPTGDWLLLLARLHAYGSDRVCSAFAVVAESRALFEGWASRAEWAVNQQHEVQRRLERQPTAGDIAVLLDQLHSGSATAELPIVDPTKRADLAEQAKGWREDRLKAAKAAADVAEAVPGQVAALRAVVREELDLGRRGETPS